MSRVCVCMSRVCVCPVCLCLFTRICVSVCLCMCLGVCACVCLSALVSGCACVVTRLCVSVSMPVATSVCRGGVFEFMSWNDPDKDAEVELLRRRSRHPVAPGGENVAFPLSKPAANLAHPATACARALPKSFAT